MELEDNVKSYNIDEDDPDIPVTEDLQDINTPLEKFLGGIGDVIGTVQRVPKRTKTGLTNLGVRALGTLGLASSTLRSLARRAVSNVGSIRGMLPSLFSSTQAIPQSVSSVSDSYDFTVPSMKYSPLPKFSLPSFSLPPFRRPDFELMDLVPSAQSVANLSAGAKTFAKYGLPAAVLAIVAASVGYAIYAHSKKAKKNKEVTEARNLALEQFESAIRQSAPTLYNTRPDTVSRIMAVAADVLKNAISKTEMTEALSDLVHQALVLERRLVPNLKTIGYESRPIGGRVRAPIYA